MITVLRLNHRRGRDDRISSHVGLTARQFGADTIIYSGEHDKQMMTSVQDLADRWGGFFEAEYREDWRRVIKAFEGVTVHLTMYGLPYTDAAPQLDASADLLVVVGAGKVPADVYDLVDHNIAVGNQPHSEVAAVAVFLDAYTDGAWRNNDFPGAEIEVVPQERGKKTREP